MPEKFENETITGHLGLVFEETSGREITRSSSRHRHVIVFEKFRFQNKMESRCFQIPNVWGLFLKSSVFVHERISVDGRHTYRNN